MFNIFLHNDNHYEYFIENAKVFRKKNLITVYFFIIMVCVLVVSRQVFVVCVDRMQFGGAVVLAV